MGLVLPDEAIEVGRNLLSNESSVTFDIGDYINDLAQELRSNASEVSRVLAYELGASEHTLRDYAYVAGRVDASDRERYPLSRHQWKACLGSKEEYLDTAKWAIEYADRNGGRPAGVRAIWAHVLGLSDEDYEAEAYIVRHVTRVGNLLRDGRFDERLPQNLQEAYGRWLNELDSFPNHLPDD